MEDIISSSPEDVKSVCVVYVLLLGGGGWWPPDAAGLPQHVDSLQGGGQGHRGAGIRTWHPGIALADLTDNEAQLP